MPERSKGNLSTLQMIRGKFCNYKITEERPLITKRASVHCNSFKSYKYNA